MCTIQKTRSFQQRRSVAILILVFLFAAAQAQLLTNGNFEGGSTGWSGCITEIGTAPTYGGTGTGRVAEVDGNFSTAATDDRLLCQSISGFTVGSIYRIGFDATRRGSGTAPTTVSVTMTMDGGAMNRTVTRSGGYVMVHEQFDFTATQTTHAFKVTPNFEGPYGMLFDNITITMVSALPVELLFFNAMPDAGPVELSWATASEQDNDHFTVERSRDGFSFEEVLRTAGAGDSRIRIDYSGIDPAPLQGLSYYRLTQTDLDGTSTHSAVVPVRTIGSRPPALALFPNPSGGGPIWLTCHNGMEKQTASLTIQDDQGRSVFSAQLIFADDVAVNLVDMVVLKRGVYAISLTTCGESLRLVVL